MAAGRRLDDVRDVEAEGEAARPSRVSFICIEKAAFFILSAV
jgi:hypothetical protein